MSKLRRFQFVAWIKDSLNIVRDNLSPPHPHTAPLTAGGGRSGPGSAHMPIGRNCGRKETARPGIEPRVSLIPEGRAKPLHYRALVGEESPTPTATRCNRKGGHECIHIKNIRTSQRAHEGEAALRGGTDRRGHYIRHPEQRSA